jgi:ubiquinone/menaquinone biosynthesis C-methylase UbiE
MKSGVDVGNHFSKHSGRYRQTVYDANKQLYKNIGSELNKNLKGVVLDIGNGGIFVYDTDRLERVIAVDLTFDDDVKHSKNIKYVIGDARDLSNIESNSCDGVVMQFLLHHIVEKSKALTDNSILAALKESHRVLNASGRLNIIEMLVFSLVEYAEDMLYGINYRLLALFNKPMVKFYSKKGLLSRLHSAGFHKIDTRQISIGSKWVDPCPALLPGLIKLPTFLYPAKCYSIVAEK